MSRKICLILSVLFLTHLSRGDELIPDICWFDAPRYMERYVQNDDPGDDPFSMQSKAVVFQSGNQTANLSAIAFSIRLIGASIGQGKVVKISPISDGQLKLLMAAEIDQKNTNTIKVEDTTLGGQKAFKIQAHLNDIYWVRVRPNRVLVVRLYGGSETLLNSVRGQLSSLKIKVSDKSDVPLVKLGKDEMQLGMSQEETRNRCGEPFEQGGPDETYITTKYLISVEFDGSNVSLISYTKLRDPKKFAEAPSGEVLKTQSEPMDDTLVKEILAEHANHGNLSWTPIGQNRWRRSDGSMAALIS